MDPRRFLLDAGSQGEGIEPRAERESPAAIFAASAWEHAWAARAGP
jgi:hypothetical protein